MRKNIILKIFIIILFSFLLVNTSYATDFDKYVELNFDKVETNEGTFYKEKAYDYMETHITPLSVSSSSSNSTDEMAKIVESQVDEYIKRTNSDDAYLSQRIEDNYTLSCGKIYSNENDTISALVLVFANPVDEASSYWKENFSNNEFYYNKYSEKYCVNIYYYTKLVKNSKTNNYEIAYIGLKPENYDTYLAELKETKGIDLENINLQKVLNINYGDDIQVVSSGNTVSINGEKNEYDSVKIKDINNISFIVRTICILMITIILILNIIRMLKKEKA